MIGTYNTHVVKPTSGKAEVTLKFDFPFEEIPNFVQTLQMLDCSAEISVQVTTPDLTESEIYKIGSFSIKQFVVNGSNLTGQFTLVSFKDYVEMDQLDQLSNYERKTPMVISVKAILPDDEETECKEDDEPDNIDDWGAIENGLDTDAWGDDDENDREDWG